MNKNKKDKSKVKYSLRKNGQFVIENYNESKPFSNFFPGIAGLWGVPMWGFYVNRGQCITSFGIETKNKSIMEFQPANKSYRLTSLQGFRTFLKVKKGRKVFYWEPFQQYVPGTDFKKKQLMSMSAHDLTLEETNEELGLKITVNYFTLPEESYAGLVRCVTIKNLSKDLINVDLIDGLPIIVPYGLTDELNKNISRTAEAWVKVDNVEKNVPFYQLSVEIADTPVVKHIKEGNFYFSFDPEKKGMEALYPAIVQSSCVFGQTSDLTAPSRFLNNDFQFPETQQTSNRTPSAMSFAQFSIAAGKKKETVSLFGYAQGVDYLEGIVQKTTVKGYISEKSKRNQELISDIKDFALTKSSSNEFDMYVGHTFLDNILRGGLPVSIKTKQGAVAFNVYSRKHGDLERDYNHFFVAPTFYSQGNGNYRDVNQNRRNDVWFNTDVAQQHIISFLNLIQADGYNPLVVKGTAFSLEKDSPIDEILDRCLAQDDTTDQIKEFLSADFLPGNFLTLVYDQKIELNVDIKDFLGQVLEVCTKKERADHGEGFWSDHWTYNLDLIESYVGLYPDQLQKLLLESECFHFYHSAHYVLPRDSRYTLTERGVRQYKSVGKQENEEMICAKGSVLRKKNGEGDVYRTTLVCKILCLIANKVATLDPSGTGVEMEADKPNWYDSLNGLPGLLGSSISEAIEVKRYSSFVLDSLNQLPIGTDETVCIFEELATFIVGLTPVLNLEENKFNYWIKSNDIKEHYRKRIRDGIEGEETALSISEIKHFLSSVIKKIDKAVLSAQDEKGFLRTYFTHEVLEYGKIGSPNAEGIQLVKPTKLQQHKLPAFLEGYVHALRAASSKKEALDLYQEVRASDLYDKKLKMYKVNVNLSEESEEIGRAKIFPSSWLENESIWLHMEYKFLLEILRNELFEEFYENFHNILVPFLKPEMYGRSVLENSSFIVSSAHQDEDLHGQGFVARLSGSTAEFMHIWLYMNVGKKPFSVRSKGDLQLKFEPALEGSLFTTKESSFNFKDITDSNIVVKLPKNTYAFNFLGKTLVVYHNKKRLNTFGKKLAVIKRVELIYPDKKNAVSIRSSLISSPYAQDIRDHKVSRIDVYFE